MNQQFLSSKGDVFAKAGLSLSQIQYWNVIQAHYNNFGFVFIEYEQEFKKEYIWRCYLESNTSTVKTLDKKSENLDGNALNSKLSEQFSDRESYSNIYWNVFMTKIKWLGFFIPVDDFSYFTNPQMEAELTHSYLFKNHFKTKEYITAIKKDSIESKYKDDPIAIFGLWQYFNFYVNFLSLCFNNEKAKADPISYWHSRNFSIKKFHTYLPSRQLSILLILVVESSFTKGLNSKKIDSLIKYAHPIVLAFFEKYQEQFASWTNENESVLLSEDMKEDFIKCCQFDKNIITTLEVVEESNFITYQPFLTYFFKERALNKSTQNIFTKIRKAIAEISILDILWFDPTNRETRPQRYIPKLNNFSFYSKIKWHQLNESIIQDIDETISVLPPSVLEKLKETVNTKWASHLVNVANSFTPPTFIWKIINNQTVPQWNLFENKTAQKHLKVFYRKQESLSAQKNRYKKVVFNLEKIKTVEEIESYVNEVESFFDPILKTQWNLKVTQHTNAIKGLQSYRERRMVELGIKDEGESVDFKTDIWLNEMLQIEDEIKKYIPFVKKAFTAALPIRKTIEFNSERHVQSGIEFDPNTINDQNKWLRGEVMKTFKSKTKLGEIEQINAFCLDYSGSMKHERMRNLFKMLYLLVLGLEDRKSFDAFHFFSSGFIEGIDFTEDFTKRSLLFKILSQVSVIREGEVKYSGYMGTNIGEGVLECHNRIHSFKEKIALKKPNSNFVCSMFVITDGEPSVGIIDLEELNEFIQAKREDGDIAIKGIYIKSEEDENNFMESIFGEDGFVETDEFGEAVNKFVTIMTNTYKEQRKVQKWKNRLKSINGRD